MIERLRDLSPEGRLVAGLLAVIAVVALALVGTVAVGRDSSSKEDVAAGSSTTLDRPTTSTTDEPSTSATADGTAATTTTTVTAGSGATTTTKPKTGAGGGTPTTVKLTSTTKPTTPVTTATTVKAPSGCATGNASYVNALSNLFTSYRSQQDLPAMTANSGLNAMAQQWAEQMACDGQLKHRGGTDVRDRVLAACSTCVRWAENVAFNFNQPNPPQAAWSGWLGSAPHLENIRKPYAGVYGFGAAQAADGKWYYAQNFGWYQ